MRFLLLLLVALIAAAPAAAQHEGILQIDDPYHHVLERQRVLGRVPGIGLGTKPISAYEARALADSALALPDNAGGGIGRADRAMLERIARRRTGPNVGWARGFAPALYQNGEAFLNVEGDGYALEFSPLAYLAAGPARITAREGREEPGVVWQNTRGARLAGHVGPYVFFESRLEENQRRDAWVRSSGWFSSPRHGHVKLQDGGVYDYWMATGMVGVRTRFFEGRFGRDRNRWGHGAGSLALSNYATVYDQLQLRTQFWRIHYTNLYARLTDNVRAHGGEDTVYPSKYLTTHRLAVDLPGRVQLELFEHTVFGDVTGAGRGFDVGYLNPIIFYRAVEVDLGSPDNVLLGAGASWIATPGVELYGQLLLTEFRASEIGSDWWGNKFGYLGGLYLVDPGWGQRRLRGLDVRVEAAWLRPYLYSHRELATTFVHHGDAAGHPVGQNAQDLAVLTRYRPTPWLEAAMNLALTRRGRDTDTENFGGDPSRPYTTRVREYGVVTLQGVRQDQVLLEGYVAAEVLPQLHIEGTLRYERVDDAETGMDRYVVPQVALRWGLPFRSARY